MLGFLGKPGFDIFGKNELFAPRLRWDTLERRVERIKKAAKDYEEAFNRVIAIKNSQNNFNEVSKSLDNEKTYSHRLEHWNNGSILLKIILPGHRN